MPIRVGLPRVRFSHENEYSNRPGFHDVQYEVILMSDHDLLVQDSVQEAIMRFTSDVYYMEAFAADYIHRLCDAVANANSSSSDSSTEPKSSDVESSSSGICFIFFYISMPINLN